MGKQENKTSKTLSEFVVYSVIEAADFYKYFSPENQIAKKWDALLDIPFFYISLIISLEVWTGSIPPQTGTDQIWAT